MSLYTRIQQIKHIQCAEEANIEDINKSFSLTTPFTKNQCFSPRFSEQKRIFLFLIEINEIGVITQNIDHIIQSNIGKDTTF